MHYECTRENGFYTSFIVIVIVPIVVVVFFFEKNSKKCMYNILLYTETRQND